MDFAGLKTVGMNGWIEAVRVSDLRAWVETTARTRLPTPRARDGRGSGRTLGGEATLQGHHLRREARVALPTIEDGAGTVKAGVTVCEAKQQRGLWGQEGLHRVRLHRNTQTSQRSSMLFVAGPASSWGFCVAARTLLAAASQ